MGWIAPPYDSAEAVSRPIYLSYLSDLSRRARRDAYPAKITVLIATRGTKTKRKQKQGGNQ